MSAFKHAFNYKAVICRIDNSKQLVAMRTIEAYHDSMFGVMCSEFDNNQSISLSSPRARCVPEVFVEHHATPADFVPACTSHTRA